MKKIAEQCISADLGVKPKHKTRHPAEQGCSLNKPHTQAKE